MKKAVLFLNFNRPDLTAQSLEAIRRYQPNKTYLAVDGPRLNVPDDFEKCEKTKKILKSINWATEIYTKFEEKNLGCKKAVSSAISWFFENEPDGIILEDDVIPEDSFFFFCEELLDRYRENERVSMISGNNFTFGKVKNRDSYFFSKYSHIWGWATWKRAWKYYNLDISNDLERFRYPVLDFDKDEFYYWNHIFHTLAKGSIDTWDLQWTFYNFIHNRVAINPSKNLVKNIGFRSDATHTTESTTYSDLKSEALSFPLMHPKSISISKKFDKYSKKLFYQTPKKSFLVRFRENFFGM